MAKSADSGTRYKREKQPLGEQEPKKEGLWEGLKRRVEDAQLRTRELRGQVALAEAQAQPAVPRSPADVTIENVHRLFASDQRPWKALETQPGGTVSLLEWQTALEGIAELPQLTAETFPTPVAHRRAVVEQLLASRYRSSSDGTVRLEMQHLLPNLLPAGTDPAAVAGVWKTIVGQVEKARKILTPKKADWQSQDEWTIGEQEILIDAIVASDLPLAETDANAPPLRDANVVALLVEVQRSITANELQRVRDEQTMRRHAAMEAEAKRGTEVYRAREQLKTEQAEQRKRAITDAADKIIERIQAQPDGDERETYIIDVLDNLENGAKAEYRDPELPGFNSGDYQNLLDLVRSRIDE